MNSIRKLLILTFGGAILFSFFFYKQSLGLNVVLFELLFLLYLIFTKGISFKYKLSNISFIGWLLSLFFFVLNYSLFTTIMHFIAFGIFVGFLVLPDCRSIYFSFIISLSSFRTSLIKLIKTIKNRQDNNKSTSSFKKLWLFVIPIIVIIVFVVLYSASNPKFEYLVSKVLDKISRPFEWFMENISIGLIFTFVIGLIVSSYLLFRKSNPILVQLEKSQTEFFERIRKRIKSKRLLIGLRNEHIAGVFLLSILNILLLVVNSIDIHWVWFNFEWEGQYLKQFVHEGTYLLILSIIISIVVVLYFFRGNLNFYSKNNLLKYLSYAWIAQNMLLAISVGVRNYWYINYFSLAYKRIGVIIFLILTLYGLYTVFLKVKNRKTFYYLIKTNSFMFYIVLLISSFLNWDIVIAKHNFNQHKTSFLHLNYMATLSDKALPHLDYSILELEEIGSIQNEKFFFAKNYMTPKEYYVLINSRKASFIKKWENQKSILSWNYAEYKAYKLLSMK